MSEASRHYRPRGTPLARRRLPESEAAFLSWVIDMAHWEGWSVAHFRPGQTERGWRTAVQADGAGFPDLVLARKPRALFAELKSDSGRLSPAQRLWLAELEGCPRSETHLWRPADRERIAEALAR